MNKALLTLAFVLTIGTLVYMVSTGGSRNFGGLATGQTAKYATASSSTISFTAATTALATSTSRTRDYFRMSAVSGTAYCLMIDGRAATASNYSFFLSSSSPVFSMENGVYQGTVSCTGTATITVSEANI